MLSINEMLFVKSALSCSVSLYELYAESFAVMDEAFDPFRERPRGIECAGRSLQMGLRFLGNRTRSFLQVGSAGPGIFLLALSSVPLHPACWPFRYRCKMGVPGPCVSI